MPDESHGGLARSRSYVTFFLVVPVFVLWTATVLALLDTVWWPFDLFAHFRIQYCVLLAACSAALIFRRHWRLAFFSLTGAVVNGFAVAATIIQAGPSVTANGLELRVVSLNVEFGNDGTGDIEEFLAGSGASVMVLQELPADKVQALASRLGGFPYVFTKAVHRSNGASVLSRWPIREESAVELAPGGRSAAKVVLSVNGTDLTLVGVDLHWPLSERTSRLRDAELDGLARLLAGIDGAHIAIGDFNVTSWSGHFIRMLDQSGSVDCARGKGWLPTWPAPLGKAGIRIDQCLASRDIEVIDVRTGPHVGSDHYPTINDFRLPR